MGNLLKDSYYLFDEYLRQRFVPPNVQLLHGPTEVSTEPGEFVVVCLVRDGEIYIRFFIEHYLALGAKHIVFLDNGSEDRTVEIAKEYPQVTILRCTLSFTWFQNNMKRYLVKRYGKDRWAIFADIDELFDFPHSDRITMKQFLHYLDSHSYTAAVTQMLDMFSDRGVEETNLQGNRRLQDLYRFYDTARIRKRPYPVRYNRLANPAIQSYFGGIRDGKFGVYCDLTKHAPQFGKGIHFLNPHHIRGANLADVSCVFYHFKFLPGFAERVQKAVIRENHWDRSAEYKKYEASLRSDSQIILKSETTSELTSLNELWQNGFLVISQQYSDYVERVSASRQSSCGGSAPEKRVPAGTSASSAVTPH